MPYMRTIILMCWLDWRKLVVAARGGNYVMGYYWGCYIGFLWDHSYTASGTFVWASVCRL